MRICHTISELSLQAKALTIGNFDGVHKGHQTLLSRTIELAKAFQHESLVITFWPHPRCVVSPSKTHCPIATREKRLEYLAAFGIDCVLELEFTRALASLSAECFVKDYLVPLNVKEMVTGYDFSLGRGREGHTEELRLVGQKWGFSVEQMPPLYLEGNIVSSTRLRALLLQGDFVHANALLGRYYELQGEVIHGCKRGRTLGFPTANLKKPITVLPSEGVYACYASLYGEKKQALLNIGHNPTFGDNPLSIECFLLDEERDLYGQTLDLALVERVRGEKKFPDARALIEQIHADIAKARDILL